MDGHGSKRRLEDQVIAALLDGKTYKQAAEATGVALSTVEKWMTRKEFRKRYNRAARTIYACSIRQCQAAVGESVATLRRNLAADRTSDQNSAAKALLDHAAKIAERDELERRIERLEEALSARNAKAETEPPRGPDGPPGGVPGPS